MVTTYQTKSGVHEESVRWNWPSFHARQEELVSVRPVVHFGRGLRLRLAQSRPDTHPPQRIRPDTKAAKAV